VRWLPNTKNMSRIRWPLPPLSIRAAVLGAIVLGVIAPALLMVAFDAKIARRFNEPIVQRSRDSLLQVTAAGLAAKALDARIVRDTLDDVVREPNVCAIDFSAATGGVAPVVLDKCEAGEPRVLRATEVLHHGARVGTLRVWFNDGELEQLLDARRQAVLQLVVAQMLFGVLVLAGVVYLRLLRPIQRLKAQASSIATRTPAPPLNWRRGDELGQLGQHLNEVRSRIDGLFDELERKNAQLRKMAMYDHLTGLPNRTLFRELFQHEVSAARRSGRSMAMLFIDLDRFKTINDSLGHAVGDEFLLGTSQRLLQALRESDLVCRHSGDEFLVLLRDADRWETVALAAERILRAVEAPLPLSRRRTATGADESAQVKVSASLGIALYPRDGEEFDALVRHADLAMYESKQQGRARYSFYHNELNEQLVTRVGLERELAHAITHGELVLHYQPVIDAANGAPRGCEALVRWQHPTRGLLLPTSFIGVAEESGLVRELGAWTLDAVCAQIARWKVIGLHIGRVSVNVSALQFRDQRLTDTLRKAMERHGVLADELELELTESALMSDDETTQRVVAVLREIGVALVVDDFGIGYSSLSYLKRLRPDKLKIDRSFVQDLPGDADDCALTQAILSMARALDIAVVAEGVETLEQRNFLIGHGCTMLQGYLSGRPQPALEFEARMRAHDSGPTPLAVSFEI
jgi:diguanylate cyclase (GGDEF)-like protein